MIFQKHIISYPLSLYIQHIVFAKGTPTLPYLIEFPEGRLNLVIELENDSVNTLYTENNPGGRHTMKRGWIAGSNSQAITYDSNYNSAILSVRFTVGGFYALTKIPIAGVVFPGLEAELLLGKSFNELYQQLINEKDMIKRFQRIEQYFLKFINDDVFENSVARFIDLNIDKPIDWLVRKSGYSQKHLICLLKKQTGFSPKYLQRLHRFQNAINSIKSCEGRINWTSVTYSNNYFDQAHFIKEFLHFTGMSPVEYAKYIKESSNTALTPDVMLVPGRL